MTINFATVTAGKHIGVGSSTMTVNFNTVTSATRKTFGSSVLPVVFSFTTAGFKSTTASSSLPIVFDFTTVGTGPTVITYPSGRSGYIGDSVSGGIRHGVGEGGIAKPRVGRLVRA
jgi:hypothetical protein